MCRISCLSCGIVLFQRKRKDGDVAAFFVPRSQDLFVLADAETGLRCVSDAAAGDTKRCVLDAIEALDSGESLFFSHYDPKTVEWFMSIV